MAHSDSDAKSCGNRLCLEPISFIGKLSREIDLFFLVNDFILFWVLALINLFKFDQYHDPIGLLVKFMNIL